MRAHTQRDLAFNTPHTQTHVRMNTRSCGRRVKYHTRPCTLRHIRTSAHACARANTYLPSSLCPSSFPPMSILQVTSSCLGEIGNGRIKNTKSTCSSNHMFHRLPKLKRLILNSVSVHHPAVVNLPDRIVPQTAPRFFDTVVLYHTFTQFHTISIQPVKTLTIN